MDRTETIKDKVCGCLYGQAVGDALGFGTEGMTKVEVELHYNYPLVELRGCFITTVKNTHQKCLC